MIRTERGQLRILERLLERFDIEKMNVSRLQPVRSMEDFKSRRFTFELSVEEADAFHRAAHIGMGEIYKSDALKLLKEIL